MSIVHYDPVDVVPTGSVSVPATQRPLHRIGTVRRAQGVSRRTIARRLNIDISQVKLQERETADMPLSQLYQWQELLEVPISELLVDAGDPLSQPVMKRAQLVRVMKTALAIMESSDEVPIQRMAETLVGQLTEIMPELVGVSPWHSVGERRRRDEYGAAAHRCISDELFVDRGE